MDLHSYLLEIKKCALNIQGNLSFTKREGEVDCYRQGFLLCGTKNPVTFNSDFTMISTALGNLHLCTSSMVPGYLFDRYNRARAKIVSELGLVRKSKKVYTTTSWHYEIYYELPGVQLSGDYTYEQKKSAWKAII